MRDHARDDEHDARYTDGDADDGLRPLHSCCFSTPDRVQRVARIYEKWGGERYRKPRDPAARNRLPQPRDRATYPFWWMSPPLQCRSSRDARFLIVSSMDGSKKRKPWRAVFGLLAMMTLAAAPAVSADLYGMLPMRDLSPFGFLRLDMRPTHAVLRGAQALDARNRICHPEHLGHEPGGGNLPD